MKARVKSTGEVVEVDWDGYSTRGHMFGVVTDTKRLHKPCHQYRTLYKDELEFISPEDTEIVGYWERLKHQYAGMAMQGFCANYNDFTKVNDGTCTNVEMICENARIIAHALVEMMKEADR